MNWISDKWEQLNPNIQLQGNKWQHNELENIKKNLHPVSHSNTECPQNESSQRINNGKRADHTYSCKERGKQKLTKENQVNPSGDQH
jgi:hypothetical protein